MSNLTELREMSDEQLELTAKEAAENLFRLRVQAQTEKLDSPSELRRNRRMIARVKTLQTERVIAAAAATK
ncbi:50S ribosomal protein L29 [Botrimarina hoheduenensis]|uniref:Large ribosomal subunit protein uL29 n=1 Tax=Botrimarina hoheduenensis TaxID=2528000 RepID=A0A5C5WAG7_9BACT|nr:50S ribosomal protein L29 [Botrimarina hoheduenensis]TWT46592.1 50S ribosomal protein L29 [Botrimarina hoheduenensis]